MPTLDNCISGVFETGNIGSNPGTVTTPQFSGYLLTRGGARIGIRTSTRPPGSVVTYSVTTPQYIIGNIKIRG